MCKFHIAIVLRVKEQRNQKGVWRVMGGDERWDNISFATMKSVFYSKLNCQLIIIFGKITLGKSLGFQFCWLWGGHNDTLETTHVLLLNMFPLKTIYTHMFYLQVFENLFSLSWSLGCLESSQLPIAFPSLRSCELRTRKRG